MILDQASIFLIIAFLASGISLFLAAYAWENRVARGASTFALLMLAIAVWTFAVGAGMLSHNDNESFSWAILRMFGVLCVPVLWLVYAMETSEKDYMLKPSIVFLLSIIPAISLILMWTSRTHQIFIREIQYVKIGSYIIDEVWVPGPWFWVHLVYSYLIILIGDFLILSKVFQLYNKYRQQAIALLVGALIPLIVNILFTFHLIPGLRVNYDPIGFVLAGLAFSWGLFRHQLFNLKPIARRLLIDSMSDCMVVIDKQQRIVDMNPAANQLIEGPVDNIIGKHISKALVTREDLSEMILNNPQVPHEVTISGQDDEDRIYDLRISPVDADELSSKNSLGYLLILREITLRKDMEKRLSELIVRDSLTTLYNHRHFFELGEHEFERSQRYQKKLSLLMIDIDNFKRINDRYGHPVGDRVLVSFSALLKHNMRDSDIAARYGGEEFAVILPETNRDGAAIIAERLRTAIEHLVIPASPFSIRLTVSIGVSVFDGQNLQLTFKQLLVQSDLALYEAKANGKNCIEFYKSKQSGE